MSDTLEIPDWISHDVDRLRSTLAFVRVALTDPALTSDTARLMAIGSIVNAHKPYDAATIKRAHEIAAGLAKPGPETDQCATCEETPFPGSHCPKSKFACGHHCNCTWIHDVCDWCGITFGPDGVTTAGGETP